MMLNLKKQINTIVVLILPLLFITPSLRADEVEPLRIICFGAHPDDAEYKNGGTAALWAQQGHKVKLVSVTNGDIGHFEMAGGTLAQRRAAEVKAAGKILGVETEVLDIHDGELLPTLENRKKIVKLIREWKADLVISHRPWDYHPDHRYVGILVQDAAFMVTVPYFCPDVPRLEKNPVFMYSSDGFQKPYPFRPDVVVAVDNVFDQKLKAVAQLVSQSLEGGAGGNPERAAKVPPADPPELRIEHIRPSWSRRQSSEANKFRTDLISIYGEEVGKKIQYAEAFELCEYGARPGKQALLKLFPIEASIPDAENK
tara:strand:- start:66992 stop:67933 length:942 start_codon:yes stop_codon:yes gene_type:complete